MSDKTYVLAAVEAPAPPAAESQAARNLRANLASLDLFQPDLPPILPNFDSAPEWLFARDGYLTARTAAGWFSGCSIPLLAAREMLKKLELMGSLGCFLSPNHAAQLRACFEKIQPNQAVVVVVPDLLNLKILLHCDDFTNEMRAARLFFVAGPDWPARLAALFEKFPGLALPQQFIRTPLLDEIEMTRLSSDAQTVISRETNRRSDRLTEIITAAPNSATGRIAVLAGSRFNLADLSNLALKRALLEDPNDAAFFPIDPDHPLSASSLALAEAAAQSTALIASDFFRADMPGVVSPETPWITWVTAARIVSPSPGCKHDGILLAGPRWRDPAIKIGWPPDRIQIAAWPTIVPPPADPPARVGIFSDISAIEIPQRVKDFSSQLLLWEYIEEELSRDPLALGENPEEYLHSRMTRLGIRDEGLDRGMFFEKLIIPTYKRTLSLFLAGAGIPLILFGRGWNTIPQLQRYAGGPIENAAQLAAAVLQCRALLEAFPGALQTAGALPLPAVSPAGLTPESLLRAVRQSLKTKTTRHHANIPALNKDAVRGLLNSAAP